MKLLNDSILYINAIHSRANKYFFYLFFLYKNLFKLKKKNHKDKLRNLPTTKIELNDLPTLVLAGVQYSATF